MSNTVDSRVVEMKFDNAQFERNVSQSMHTLDNLKKQLDMTESTKSLVGLQNAADKVDFASMQSALESLQSRFSTMGIVGMTVVQNLTTAAMGFVGNITKGIINMAKTGGISRAMNIEQAKFQLSGLSVQWSDIKDDIDYAVSGTAYGLDAAAVAASQFVASGVKFGKESEAMRNALRGISGVAAMTNSSYEDTARIFTTVAGNGRLMGDQLNQLGARGLNAAATLVEYFDKVKEGSIEASDEIKDKIEDISSWASKQKWYEGVFDESALRKTVSEGLVDFELFSEAMDSTFGEHAKKANNTFKGAMSNIKAALSRIGADFVTPLVKGITDDQQEMATRVTNLVDVFGKIIPIINGVKQALGPVYTEYTKAVGNISDGMVNALEKVKLFQEVTNGDGSTVKVLTVQGQKISDIFVNIWTIITNVGKAISSILNPIGSAFKDIFGGTILNGVKTFTSALAEMSKSLSLTSESSSNLQRTFRGVFAAVDILKQVFLLFFNVAIKPGLTLLDRLGVIALKGTGSVGDFLVTIDEKLKEINKWLLPLTNNFSEFVSTAIKNFNLPGIDGLNNKLGKVREVLSNAFIGIKDFLSEIFNIDNVSKGFSNLIGSLTKGLQSLGEGVKIIFGGIVKGIKDAILNADIGGIADVINTAIGAFGAIQLYKVFGTWGKGIFYLIGNIKDLFNTFKKGTQFGANFVNMFNNLSGTLFAMQRDLKADMLKQIAIAVATLAGSLFVLSLIDSQKLTVALSAIGAMMAELSAVIYLMNSITNINTKGFFGTIKGFVNSLSQMIKLQAVTSGMISIGVALIFMSFALSTISDLDWGQLGVGLTGITVMLGEMAAVMTVFSKLNVSGTNGITSMIAIAIAMKILASVLKDIASIEDPEALVNALLSMISIISTMGILFTVLGSTNKKGKNNVKIPDGLWLNIIALAAGMKILASVLKDIASIQPDELNRGLASMGAILLGLTAFYKIIGSFKATSVVGVGSSTSGTILPKGFTISLIALAGSIKIIASVVKDLGSLNADQISSGLLSLGGIIVGFMALFKSIPTSDNVLKAGMSMVIMAGAIKILGGVVEQLSGLNWDELARGLLGMTGGLGALALVLKVLSGLSIGDSNTSLIKTAGAMVIMAAAVRVLVPALESMGAMSNGEVARSLITLAGALTILGVAAAVIPVAQFTALAGGLALVGASVALFGAGVFMAGAGLVAIAAGVASLAAALAGGATAIALGLKTIFFTFLESIPEYLDILAQSAPAFAKVFVAYIEAACIAIVGSSTVIAKAFIELLTSGLQMLSEQIPIIGNLLFDIVLGILDVISERTPELVSKAVDIFGNIFSNLFDYLKLSAIATELIGIMSAFAALFLIINQIGPMVKNGAKTAALMVGVFALLGGVIVLLEAAGIENALPSVMALGLLFVELSVAMLILSNIPIGSAVQGALALGAFVAILGGVVALLGGIAQIPGAKWIVEEGAAFMQAIGEAIGGFVGGIVGGAIEAATSVLPAVGENLAGFMENAKPFFDGVKGFDAGTGKAIAALAAAMVLITGAEIIDGIAGFITGGGSSIVEFGKKLNEFAPYFNSFYTQVKDIDGAVIEKSANAALALAEFARKIPNEGGWLGKVMGENDIAVFGQKLEEFAPHLAAYCDTISSANINEEAVVASANAASALAEFASNIPNEGGWLGKVMGENDIAVFGEKLAEFAPFFKTYADTVKDINPDVVIASATAATSLAELANNLPNSPGALDWLIGGKMDLSTFGPKLVGLGRSLSLFSNSISGINAAAISSAIKSFNELASLLKNIQNYSGDSFTNFKIAFEQLAKLSVEGFINTFSNSTVRVKSTINSMLMDVIKTINTKKTPIVSAFNNIFTLANSRIRSQRSSMITSVNNVLSGMLNSFKSYNSKFQNAGKSLIDNFIKGFNNKHKDFVTACNKLSNTGYTTLSSASNIQGFYVAGQNCVAGFVKGVQSKINDAANIGGELGRAALRAAMKALDEHSPSKEFFEVGANGGQGFINGLKDFVELSYNSGYAIGQSSLDGVNDAIDRKNTIDIKYTVDISQLKQGSREAQKAIEEYINKAKSSSKTTLYGKNLGESLETYYKQFSTDIGDVDTFLKGLSSLTGKSYGNFITDANGKLIDLKNSYYEIITFMGKGYDKITSSFSSSADKLKVIDEYLKTLSDNDRYNISEKIAQYTRQGYEFVDAFIQAQKEAKGFGEVLVDMPEDISTVMRIKVDMRSLQSGTEAAHDAVISALADMNSDQKKQVLDLMNTTYKSEDELTAFLKSHAIATKGTYKSIIKGIDITKNSADSLAISQKYLNEMLSKTPEIAKKVESAAKSFMQTNPSLTFNQALSRVIEQNPDWFKSMDDQISSFVDSNKVANDEAQILSINLSKLTNNSLEASKAIKEYIKQVRKSGTKAINGKNLADELENWMKNYAKGDYTNLNQFLTGMAKLTGESYGRYIELADGRLLDLNDTATSTADKLKAVDYYMSNLGVEDKGKLVEKMTEYTRKGNSFVAAFIKAQQETIGFKNLILDLPEDIVTTVHIKVDVGSLTADSKEAHDAVVNAMSSFDAKTQQKIQKLMGSTYKKDNELDAFMKSWAVTQKKTYDNVIKGVDLLSTDKKGKSTSAAKKTATKFLNDLKKKDKKSYDKLKKEMEKINKANKNKKYSEAQLLGLALRDSGWADKLKINNKLETFIAGENFSKGVVSGIYSQIPAVNAAGSDTGQAALSGYEDRLKIESPSKVMYKSGRFTGEGVVNGLRSMISNVGEAGSDLGDAASLTITEAMSTIAAILDSDLEYEPVITPIIDMSNVKNSLSKLNSELSRIQAIDISAKMNSSNNDDNSNSQDNLQNGGNTYTFTQNNYSPKALSRSDIYRNTKNQFSQFREVTQAI